MSKIVPLFGTSQRGRSDNVTAQRRINLYPEPVQDGDKSPLVFYTRPGLRVGFTGTVDNPASDVPGGPIRGMLSYYPSWGPNGVMIGAQGNKAFYAPNSLSLNTKVGFFSSSAGPVQIATDGSSIVYVDGVTAYEDGVGRFSTAYFPVTGFPDGARSICVIASRYVVDDPSYPGRFRWSGVLDYTDWNALNYATAESSDDPLVQVFERGGELLLFGNRMLEFWAPTGATDVFARVGGSGIDWGLGVFDSVRKANSSVFFIGRNLGGQPQVCELQGYQVRIASTPDVDKLLNDALESGVVPVTSVVTHSGHTWYIVNLVETSLVYDTTTGIWCEWQTDGRRWAGNYSSQYMNTTIVADYRDGRLYYFDANRCVDGEEAIAREIVSRHAFADLRQMALYELELDVEVGVGLASGSAPIGPLRTNLVLSSQVYSSTWFLGDIAPGVDVMGPAVMAPDTTITGSKLTLLSNGLIRQTVASVPVDTYVASIYVREGNAATVVFNVFWNGFTEIDGTFTFATGTFTGGAPGSNFVAEYVGADWYRLSYTVASQAGTDIQFRLWPGGRPGSAGAYCYAWGAQLEAATYTDALGIPIPTSYIATIGAPVVAAGDPIGPFVYDSGSDPQIMLQVSKDGGHTWGNELWRSLGAQGQYSRRVTWKRLGIAKDWVFRFRVSDPVKVVIMNAAANFG